MEARYPDEKFEFYKKCTKTYTDRFYKPIISLHKKLCQKRIYLFDSQATGMAHENSDIDIAIIMENLPKGKSYMERKMDLRKLTRNIDTRIEPIILEENDINEKDPSIMGYEVLKHGILIS